MAPEIRVILIDDQGNTKFIYDIGKGSRWNGDAIVIKPTKKLLLSLSEMVTGKIYLLKEFDGLS